MNKKVLLGCAAVLTMGSIIFFGCKKDASDLVNEAVSEQQSAIDNELAQSGANDAVAICNNAQKAHAQGKPQFRINGDSTFCNHIDTLVAGGFKYIICDFGSGVTGPDGVTRKGKMQVKWSQDSSYDSPTCTKTIEFQNYSYRNRNIKKGTISYSGKNNVVGDKINMTMSDIEIATVSGTDSTSTINSGNITQEVVAYNANSTKSNVYQYTGGVKGTSAKGQDYSTTILTPLYKKMDCGYIIAGQIQFTFGANKRTLDFGQVSDGCDDNASMIIDGVTYKFKFKGN